MPQEIYRVARIIDAKCWINLVLEGGYVQLHRLKTNQAVARGLEGEEVVISAKNLPPEVNQRVNWVSYKGRFIYPVFA